MNLPNQEEVMKKVSDFATDLVMTYDSILVVGCLAVQLAEIARNLRSVSPAHAKLTDDMLQVAIELSKVPPTTPPKVIHISTNKIEGLKQ